MRLIKALLLLAVVLTSSAQNKIIKKGDVLYLADKVVVKFKETAEKTFYKNVEVPTASVKKLESVGMTNIKQSVKPAKVEAVNYKDLINTYVIEYSSPYDPKVLSEKLSKLNEIEWAEPWYVYEISFEPDDPKYTDGTQWYLNKIAASQAWDLGTGNEEIVIAINDTGVDWDHPDLAANIWVNEDEIPGDGQDNDGNGYKDDVRGWDFGGLTGTPDNDPMEDDPTHGTYVAGLASAVTNNGEGVASIGYRCKIMPVKTSQEDVGNTFIIYGREGIVYAADNGADIINCSWGGSPYSQALQDAITYATSLGALVVSSSDNNNSIEPSYPSAYFGVLSIGGTDANDVRYSASNYGATVDLVAPATGSTTAQGMYGTWQFDPSDSDPIPYISGSSGTSLASPIVAGIAGLVMDRFPEYNSLQVAEQIRVNTDDIRSANDSYYDYYLGTGRVNALKAVNNTESISMRIEEEVYTDLSNGNGVTEPGENFSLGIKVKNYLNPASNVQITLESRSDYVTVNQNSFTVSSLGTLQETNNLASPFTFTIAGDIPVNQDVELLVKFNYGNGFNDFQLIRTKFNTTFLTQNGNDISLTIASEGNLGFNDFGSNPTEGDGLSFLNGPNLLYEGALIYASSRTMVMDAAHVNNTEQSQDFDSVIPFSLSTPGTIADQQGFTLFNDNGAQPNNIGIETELHTYSFSEDKYSDFIILRYMFHNTTDTLINNFHAGVFFDLDFNDFNNDHTLWDDVGKFGYAFDEDPNESSRIDDMIGVALISDTKYEYRAFTNNELTDPSSPYGNNGFTEQEKWYAVASALSIREKGPDDIAFAVSGGPYQIQPAETLSVAFSVVGGYSVEQLKNNVDYSREAYKERILNPVIYTPAVLNSFEYNSSADTINFIWSVSEQKLTNAYHIYHNDSLITSVKAKDDQQDSIVYNFSYTGLNTGENIFDLYQVFNNFNEVKIGSISISKEVVYDYKLSQNFPNPFNPTSKIKYQIARSGKVELKVYDTLGREVRTLVNEIKQPGSYEVEFNAGSLSSGVYLYKLTSGSFVETKKMMLIK